MNEIELPPIRMKIISLSWREVSSWWRKPECKEKTTDSKGLTYSYTRIIPNGI